MPAVNPHKEPAMQQLPAQFEDHAIRRVYDETRETWWFSVVDIVQVLTRQPDYQAARKYWNKLKERLGKEGNESVTNCHRLKLTAADGKNYLTDVATAETLLRLVQSVPSPKAEPIKLWLAKVGYERMQELADPALALDRARATWQKHGCSEKWINQRMMGEETRAKLTDYWASHEIKAGQEFAILTNLIHEEWTGLGVKDHKQLKGLKTQNLRDHMSWERGRQKSSGLQKRLPGPYFRRFLAHGTTMGRRTVDCCPHAATFSPRKFLPPTLPGRTDLYRAGRTVHPTDRRDHAGNGYAGEQGGCEERWCHRKARPAGAGKPNREEGGDRRKLSAATAPEALEETGRIELANGRLIDCG
jgi:DNA-damage-inducible protein D